MARVFLLCGFLSYQVLLCLSQNYSDYQASHQSSPEERDQSVREYFMEAVDWMNRTRWRYFLPEDTDIDLDGNLSDLEVQLKFNTYMGEVFKLMDQDKDNSITEEELRSLKLDIPHLTKVVDIALENFPLKPFFLAADRNGDGFYDEDDFYLPEEMLGVKKIDGASTNVTIGSGSDVRFHGPDWAIYGYNQYGFPVANIGQNEGTVICKSKGYSGLDRVVELGLLKKYEREERPVAYSCNGTEEMIEDCKMVVIEVDKSNYGPGRQRLGMGVVCQGPIKFAPLRLVGGKDSSSGDIYLGNEGLVCIYDRRHRRSTAEVVCRELGYSGVLRFTTKSAFTGVEPDARMDKSFQCKGNEEKLGDCPFSDDCGYSSWLYGVKCAKEGEYGTSQELSDLIQWNDMVFVPVPFLDLMTLYGHREPVNIWDYIPVLITLYHIEPVNIWEKVGRFLFIADSNGDGKLTMEEIATKGKELMKKILEFLDENQDGKISLEDIDLHLSIGPVQNLASELFDGFARGEGEIDLFKLKFLDNLSRDGLYKLKFLDKNGDWKLNAADIFPSYGKQVSQVSFLIPLLSEKLDKNQDGKIQREELTQFINEMFNHMDLDKDGAITLEDAYSLLRDKGLNCVQVGAFRTFTKVLLEKIDSVTRNFFSYIFHQFDIDGSGRISTTELEQMHIPCDTSGRYNNIAEEDPTAKKSCEGMFETYFGKNLQDLIRSFPDFVFSERRGRERGRFGLDEAQKETLVDKMTQHACEMLM